MNEEQREAQERQEHFPYKTYEEILAEKERWRWRQHGLVVMTGLFLLCCAVVVGVSMVWNRTTDPGTLLTHTSEDQGFNLSVTDPAEPLPGTEGEPDASFRLPDAAETTEDGGDAMLVTDVSGVVKKARASVVGIEAEIYSGYVTSRTGSGIILTEDGYIITNSHVISGCDSINVTLDDGGAYSAFVIGDDSYSDIAILKIDAQHLTPAELGDSDQVEVGQAAIAIGNPTGQLQGTATFGIISGVNRNIMVENTVMNLLQTDAAINSGNSGGPLLNQQGQVIGISSAKVSISGYEGLGFAIPINTARPIAEELVRSGSVSGRPALGLSCSKLSTMASNFYGLPAGLYVTAVEKGSCAETAGVQVGDVITGFNAVRVRSLSEAYTQRNLFKAGEQLEVSVYRKGMTRELSLCLDDQRELSESCNY